MNKQEIDHAEALSMQSTPFPQVVAKLVAAGVETYYTDLLCHQKTFYGGEGESHVVHTPLEQSEAIAPTFSAEDVKAAIKAIQQREITYPEFLRRIQRGGTLGYLAFLSGRRVLYFGRDGQFHVELFPPKP